jgi:hypothetical protein
MGPREEKRKKKSHLNSTAAFYQQKKERVGKRKRNSLFPFRNFSRRVHLVATRIMTLSFYGENKHDNRVGKGREGENFVSFPQTKYCSAAHPQGSATFMWNS